MQGIVRWFDARIGYGFIVSPELLGEDGKERDIFVHYSKIEMEGFKKAETGESVSFELVWGPNGKPQAEMVVRSSLPAAAENS